MFQIFQLRAKISEPRDVVSYARLPYIKKSLNNRAYRIFHKTIKRPVFVGEVGCLMRRKNQIYTEYLD